MVASWGLLPMAARRCRSRASCSIWFCHRPPRPAIPFVLKFRAVAHRCAWRCRWQQASRLCRHRSPMRPRPHQLSQRVLRPPARLPSHQRALPGQRQVPRRRPQPQPRKVRQPSQQPQPPPAHPLPPRHLRQPPHRLASRCHNQRRPPPLRHPQLARPRPQQPLLPGHQPQPQQEQRRRRPRQLLPQAYARPRLTRPRRPPAQLPMLPRPGPL